MTLPDDIDPATQLVIGKLALAQEAMTKAASWLDTARGDRDHCIAQLRTNGWTIRQLTVLTGLSHAMLEKICKIAGVVPTRGAYIKTPR